MQLGVTNLHLIKKKLYWDSFLGQVHDIIFIRKKLSNNSHLLILEKLSILNILMTNLLSCKSRPPKYLAN